MNRDEKKKYLERYKYALMKSKELDQTRKTLSSVDYTRIKTSTHATLLDRIHKCDKAYDEMVQIMCDIEKLLEDKHPALAYRYIHFKTTKQIGDILYYSEGGLKKLINRVIDELDI